MTESQWQNCTDPDLMLNFLRDRASDRKLRLFACACRRAIWDLLDEHGQQDVAAAERAADDNANRPGTWLAVQAEATGVASAASTAARARGGDAAARAAWDEQRRTQCALLRDIFQPFRPPRIDPQWLSANGGAAGRLAGEIYEQGAFSRLPELADLLMDADCQEDRLLSHCHSVKGHVRGCWVLDALLGKE